MLWLQASTRGGRAEIGLLSPGCSAKFKRAECAWSQCAGLVFGCITVAHPASQPRSWQCVGLRPARPADDPTATLRGPCAMLAPPPRIAGHAQLGKQQVPATQRWLCGSCQRPWKTAAWADVRPPKLPAGYSRLAGSELAECSIVEHPTTATDYIPLCSHQRLAAAPYLASSQAVCSIGTLSLARITHPPAFAASPPVHPTLPPWPCVRAMA